VHHEACVVGTKGGHIIVVHPSSFGTYSVKPMQFEDCGQLQEICKPAIALGFQQETTRVEVLFRYPEHIVMLGLERTPQNQWKWAPKNEAKWMRLKHGRRILSVARSPFAAMNCVALADDAELVLNPFSSESQGVYSNPLSRLVLSLDNLETSWTPRLVEYSAHPFSLIIGTHYSFFQVDMRDPNPSPQVVYKKGGKMVKLVRCSTPSHGFASVHETTVCLWDVRMSERPCAEIEHDLKSLPIGVDINSDLLAIWSAEKNDGAVFCLKNGFMGPRYFTNKPRVIGSSFIQENEDEVDEVISKVEDVDEGTVDSFGTISQQTPSVSEPSEETSIRDRASVDEKLNYPLERRFIAPTKTCADGLCSVNIGGFLTNSGTLALCDSLCSFTEQTIY